MESGDLLPALSKFETAVSLRPDSKRYREALEETKDQVLNQGLKRAQEARLIDFEDLFRIAALCVRIRADDARALEVQRIAERSRREIEASLDKALQEAANGRTEAAKALLAPAEAAPSRFPRLAAVKKEIEYLGIVAASRALQRDGELLRACAVATEARAAKPLGGEAEALLEELAQGVSAKFTSFAEEAKNTATLGELGMLLFALKEIVRECPRAGELIQSGPELTRQYERRFSAVWSLHEKSAAPASSWARCAMAAEGMLVVGPTKKAELERFCAEIAGSRAPRVGFAISGDRRCVPESLESRIASELPSGITLVPISADFRGQTAQDVDVTLLLDVETCDYVPLTVTGAEPIASTYVSGYDEISNPEYYSQLERVRSAEANVARLQAQQAANPSNAGLPWQVAAAQIGLSGARKRLSEEQPFELLPRIQPYRLERVELATGMMARGSIKTSDPGNPLRAHALPLEVVASRKGEAIRGAHPSDQEGHVNREPSLASSSELSIEVRSRTAESVIAAAMSSLPAYCAARASQLFAEKRYTEGLGYLASARLFRLPKGSEELESFLTQNLRSVLLTPEELAALNARLGLFATQFESGQGVEAATQAAAVGAIETSLRAVVVIRAGANLGTGFIVSSGGLILTNHHVVEDSAPIEIELANGDSYLGKVLASDRTADLALLKINAAGLSFLRFASAQEARIGQDVFALGSPKGLKGSVTKGIVSARRRDGDVGIIQIDASINSGNSGGPVVLPDGRVVAVVSFKATESEGMGFAIAIEEAQARFGSALRR